MLSLFARRVTLSAYRSGAAYSRILPSSVSALRDRRVLDTGLHTGLGRTFTNPRRNAGTNATATTNKTKSTTSGRTKPKKELTPKQKEALEKKATALKAKEKARAQKEKAQAKKEKEAAALKRKRHEEKMKRIAEAKKGAYTAAPCSLGMSYSAISVACISYQTSSEAHESICRVCAGYKETSQGGFH